MPLHITTGKPGVLWHGSFFVHHSLAHVNRELVLALLETGRVEVGLDHYEPPTFDPAADPRHAPLAARLSVVPDAPAVTVRHRWPPEFGAAYTRRLALIQPWEFGALPAAWVREMSGEGSRVDEVWVPSSYVRECYVASGVAAEKVVVVPNGVNTARFHPDVTPCERPTRKGFMFLFVGGTIARKGIDVLLDAYSRAFTADDDVSLVIKDFGTDTFYAGQGAGALIAALQAKPGAPEIVHLRDELSEEGIAALYASCDALVHPYRGEGYGLPIAEAMACGKPAVVTGYGAALDFANGDSSYLVPAKRAFLQEARIGDMETVGLPWWAEPDRDALVDILRDLYQNPAKAREVGARAARDIAARHTWAHAAAIAADRLVALSERAESASAPRFSVPVAFQPPAAPTLTAIPYEQRKQDAIALTRAGNWAYAVRDIEACLTERPDDWDLVNALSVALYRSGARERAVARMREGIERAPNPRDFHHNLAFLLLDGGDALEALQHATSAFEQGPGSSEIRRTLTRARLAALRESRRIRRRVSGKGRAGAKGDAAYDRLIVAIDRAGALLDGKVDLTAPLPVAPPPAPKPLPRLSVVMIAKNEERFLRECLESVRGVADEIVLVDTGSTDGTLAIAREFGAKVIEHAWTDDFSAARNVSLDHATGDWALWLDADERLAKDNADLLRYLMHEAEPNVGGYMVNIRNVMQLRDDPEVCWHRACRLFRLQPDVRFTGRIHEQNMRSLQAAGYVCALSQLTLDHYGYAAEIMDERNKHERFIRMLTREVEENPDDQYRTFHLFNLANAWFTRGDMKTAATWFEKAAESADVKEEYTAILFVEWATSLYATGRAAEALEVCDRAEKLGVRHPSLDFARGHSKLHLKDYRAAERHFRDAIEGGKRGQFVQTGDEGAYGYKASYGLALAVTGQDRWSEAVDHCRTAIADNARFTDARYLLATALRRCNRPAEARQELHALLERAPEHAYALADLGSVLCELGDHAAALTVLRQATMSLPDSLDAWVRLAECCERFELLEEARDAWQAARRLAPRAPELLVNLGRAHAALGEDAQAIDLFADAILLDPRHANAYFNAADVLYRLGNYVKAAETVEAGLRVDPSSASGFFVLGNCLFQTRDYAAATLAYEAALAIRPDYAEARGNLALAREMQQETAPAA